MRRIFQVLAVVILATLPLRERHVLAKPSKLVVERHQMPSKYRKPVGDGVVTLIRLDPRHYRLSFLGEHFEGRRRGMPDWVNDFDLEGGINAGMFLPNGKSVGYQKAAGKVRSSRRPSKFKGVLAFQSGAKRASDLRIGGKGCKESLSGLDDSHDSVQQVRALLLGCMGQPMSTLKSGRYSVAAIGVDKLNNIVLLHSRTPYRMDRFASALAEMKLGLRGVAYLEGGPEASLLMKDTQGKVIVREKGSWEDGFNPNDRNRRFWDLPNIIGIEKR